MSDKPADERLIKSAFGVLKRFRRTLEDHDYTLEKDVEDRIVIGALEQHGEHLSVHHIDQKSIDAFKLVCWLGGCLLNEEKAHDDRCEKIIEAMIQTLRYFLVYESDYWLPMPPQSQGLLKSFLLQERAKNSKHGIWMNGLYVAFHCAFAAWDHGQKTRTKAM